mmetsp:Transcript_28607/g.58138  ORF Transcript_28607/g.58138 Transcript_28607/m.58138 type:complete len:179 (+) Transcript_28607:404-940(+)
MSAALPSPMSRQTSHSSKRQKTDHEQDDDGIPIPEVTDLDYVNLTTHADTFGIDPVPISWAHPDPLVRGPVICTVRHFNQRNAIGAHSGSYCIYSGLALAAGKLSPDYVPNLKLTSPVCKIGPHPSWNDPKKIASIDPFGHCKFSSRANMSNAVSNESPSVCGPCNHWMYSLHVVILV